MIVTNAETPKLFVIEGVEGCNNAWVLFKYGVPIKRNKTIGRPSYLKNWNPYTAKTAYLYSDKTLGVFCVVFTMIELLNIFHFYLWNFILTSWLFLAFTDVSVVFKVAETQAQHWYRTVFQLWDVYSADIWPYFNWPRLLIVLPSNVKRRQDGDMQAVAFCMSQRWPLPCSLSDVWAWASNCIPQFSACVLQIIQQCPNFIAFN